MEIRYGLELLEGGRQRASLEEAFAKTVERDFAGRVLPFDHAAARIAGVIEAKRRRAGRPISVPDVQIASIALMHNAALATRNTRDFDGIGLPLINPWTA